MKFENNTSGRARLWDTALKFLAQAFSLRHQITWIIYLTSVVSFLQRWVPANISNWNWPPDSLSHWLMSTLVSAMSIVVMPLQREEIDPLPDPVTWYKITHAGEQVAQRDFQNKATRTSPPWPAFVLEVPLYNLLTSMCDFVPCDQILQRTYYTDNWLPSQWYVMFLWLCDCHTTASS